VNPRNLAFGLTALLGIVADQGTKRWVVANLEPGRDEIVLIPDFMSIVHAQNTGAAFSTMEGQMVIFLVFTIIAVFVVLDLVRRQEPLERFVPMTLGMIFAGAVGNGLDRLLQGHVTDMIKNFAGFEPAASWFVERFGTNVWPIYNIADSLLLVGVAAFGLHYLFQGDREPVTDEDAVEAA
jgi:signal peptidase II